MNTERKIENVLNSLSIPSRIAILQKFFQTAKGQYAEGDKFLGMYVPTLRKVALEFIDLPLPYIEKLIQNKIHEYRLTALMILSYRYKRLGQKTENLKEKKKIVDFYLKNIKYINNWDLVDCSCYSILGAWIYDNKDRISILYKMARSKNLWQRRISIVSTYYFIKRGQFKDTFEIASILMNDRHDLIHKAVGWMLREIGKMDSVGLVFFLKKHSKIMPRTMLRYAIERFDPVTRKMYLNNQF